MKITHPAIHRLGGLLGSAAVRLWMRTLDYQAIFYDPVVDPANRNCAGQKIYVFWHEHMLLPIHMRGHCNLAMLVSRHRDGEMLTHAARHLGFSIVRGSTSKGGAAALRDLMTRSREMNLAITPDGPRGPRRTMAQGAVYLASRLQMPLVAMGLGCDSPWRLKSWDRFAIPRPGSRARGVIGPAIHLPPDLDRDGIEHYRQRMECLLNELTQEAEAWAAAGDRKPQQHAAHRQQLRRHLYSARPEIAAPQFPEAPSIEAERFPMMRRIG